MACLWCQKLFSEHNKEELVICIDWIQNQLHIISQNYVKLLDSIPTVATRGNGKSK